LVFTLAQFFFKDNHEAGGFGPEPKRKIRERDFIAAQLEPITGCN
jgi:hypothetical protein